METGIEKNGAQATEREEIFSKSIRAGKRTYFFDVKATRGNDFYLTITESKKRFGDDGKFFYEKHKLFLYKEDFNKFMKGLTEAVDYVKTDLMPDFDFDAFNHDTPYEGEEGGYTPPTAEVTTNEETVVAEQTEDTPAPVNTVAAEEDHTPLDNGSTEEVDKW